MKKTIAILFAIVTLLVVAAWLLGYSEKSASHFETYQQLKESELIDKGWVPRIIPKSSYDIHERHRVDVGRVNVKFRFKPGDTKEIEAGCIIVDNGDANIRTYRCNHGREMVIVKLADDGKGEIISE